jgi:hypothetical protein
MWFGCSIADDGLAPGSAEKFGPALVMVIPCFTQRPQLYRTLVREYRWPLYGGDFTETYFGVWPGPNTGGSPVGTTGRTKFSVSACCVGETRN